MRPRRQRVDLTLIVSRLDSTRAARRFARSGPGGSASSRSVTSPGAWQRGTPAFMNIRLAVTARLEQTFVRWVRRPRAAGGVRRAVGGWGGPECRQGVSTERRRGPAEPRMLLPEVEHHRGDGETPGGSGSCVPGAGVHDVPKQRRVRVRTRNSCGVGVGIDGRGYLSPLTCQLHDAT